MTPLVRNYSLRSLLLAVVVFAGLSLVAAAAYREQTWAVCVLMALASVVGLFLLHVLAFVVAAALSGTVGRLSRRRAARPSPFAEAGVLPERQADRPIDPLAGD